MINGIILIALGIIIMAILGAIGNSLIQKGRTEKAQENKNEVIENQDSSKIELTKAIEDSRDSVLTESEKILKGQEKSNKSISELKKKQKPEIKVENSPNTVIQLNEKGDNIINEHIPEPKITIEESKSYMSDNIYTSINYLTIDSKININSLYIEARANTIIEFNVRPEKAGMLMSGPTGKGDGFAYTDIKNAFGTYILILRTRQPEEIKFITKILQ